MNMTLSAWGTATTREMQRQKRRRVTRLKDCRKQRLKPWQRTLVLERPGRINKSAPRARGVIPWLGALYGLLSRRASELSTENDHSYRGGLKECAMFHTISCHSTAG